MYWLLRILNQILVVELLRRRHFHNSFSGENEPILWQTVLNYYIISFKFTSVARIVAVAILTPNNNVSMQKVKAYDPITKTNTKKLTTSHLLHFYEHVSMVNRRFTSR